MLFRIGFNHLGCTACAAILLGRSGGKACATAITSVLARTTVNPVDTNIVRTLSDSLTVPIAVTSQPFSVTALDHFLFLDFSCSLNDDIAVPSKFVVSAA